MNSEFEGSPRGWPPLGLPIGSVRALLTIIVMTVVMTRLVRDLPVDVLWIQTLLIALAHYFTSRRFVTLPPDVIARLEQDGVIEREGAGKLPALVSAPGNLPTPNEIDAPGLWLARLEIQ